MRNGVSGVTVSSPPSLTTPRAPAVGDVAVGHHGIGQAGCAGGGHLAVDDVLDREPSGALIGSAAPSPRTSIVMSVLTTIVP